MDVTPKSGKGTGVREGVIAFTLANYLNQGLNAVTGFVVRGILPPEVFGAFFLVNTFKQYLGALVTPIANIIDIQLPLMAGKGEEAEGRKLMQQAYTILFWLLVAEVLILQVIGYFKASTPLIMAAFLVLGICHFFEQTHRVDRLLLKSNRQFRTLLKAAVVTNTFRTVVVITLAITWGGNGYLVGVGVASLASFSLFRWLACRQANAGWRLFSPMGVAGKVILTAGLAITVFKLGYEGMMTIDRFFVESAFGLREVGIYSMAVAMANLLRILPKSVAGAVMPTYLRMAKNSNPAVHRRNTRRYHRFIVSLALLVAVGAMPCVEPFLAWLFPNYVGCADAARILFVAMVVQQAGAAPLAFAFGSERRWVLIALAAGGFLSACVFCWLLTGRFGMEGAATGTVAAFTVSFTALTFDLPREMRLEVFLVGLSALLLGGGAAAIVIWDSLAGIPAAAVVATVCIAVLWREDAVRQLAGRITTVLLRR